ncbi:MAG: hypothetical protein Q9176_000474 [Flavoplaca citrina]
MGGDLNLKKSWHPVLMTNQRRVWEEEKKALDERKRIEQMMKERQEERQIQELQEMQEAAGGKKRLNRVDWMYAGPSAGQAGTTEEMEGYLLGKRRIDGLLKGTENQKLEKEASQESFMALQKANTVRDTASKIREDPMLAIKKQEQAAFEALMNDPVKRRLLLKAAGGDITEKSAIAASRDGQMIMTDPVEEVDTITDDGRFLRPTQDHHLPTVKGRGLHTNAGADRHRLIVEDAQMRVPFGGLLLPIVGDDHRRSVEGRRLHMIPTVITDLNRLAAMQTNATELDQDREKRIAAIAEKENEERKADAIARARSAKYDGRGDFVSGLNRKAGDLDIGERMRRGRQALGREGRDDD